MRHFARHIDGQNDALLGPGRARGRAKGRADAAVVASGLDHLILRPVRLTDEPATSRISLVREPESLESEFVPRADVAAVLAEAIAHHPEAAGTWNLSSGEKPVSRAFA